MEKKLQCSELLPSFNHLPTLARFYWISIFTMYHLYSKIPVIQIAFA